MSKETLTNKQTEILEYIRHEILAKRISAIYPGDLSGS